MENNTIKVGYFLDNNGVKNEERRYFSTFLSSHVRKFLPVFQRGKIRTYTNDTLEEAWSKFIQTKAYLIREELRKQEHERVANMAHDVVRNFKPFPTPQSGSLLSVGVGSDGTITLKRDVTEDYLAGLVRCHATALKVKLSEGALMPTRAHKEDVGIDIKVKSIEFIDCANNEEFAHAVIIDTGVAVEPPAGYYVEVVPNSRLAKTYYYYGNSFGVIDPNYRGTIKVVLRAPRPIAKRKAMMHWKYGTVCGQLILRKAEYCDVVQVDELSETERGDGGFGSTAK